MVKEHSSQNSIRYYGHVLQNAPCESYYSGTRNIIVWLVKFDEDRELITLLRHSCHCTRLFPEPCFDIIVTDHITSLWCVACRSGLWPFFHSCYSCDTSDVQEASLSWNLHHGVLFVWAFAIMLTFTGFREN